MSVTGEAGVRHAGHSCSLPTTSSLSPPTLPLPPPPCHDSLPFRTWVSPLLPYPHLNHPSGSCLLLCRPACVLPCPWPLISPVRTKMSVTGEAGVRHAGQIWADPCHTGISLTGPSPNKSTLCTVGRHSNTYTPWRTVLWWSRLSAGCCCSTAWPAHRPV